jgi:Arc/MetJ-type ribon-helix-helix transcriptional regulator
MAKSISVNKKSRGRPKKAGGVDPVSAVRLPMDLTEQVDRWGEGQKLSRSEAIRRLVELGLTLKTKGHQSKEGQKKRAHEMAGTAIDDMMDTATSPDDQASRKRRLLKGPEEFRNVRVDRPKR